MLKLAFDVVMPMCPKSYLQSDPCANRSQHGDEIGLVMPTSQMPIVGGDSSIIPLYRYTFEIAGYVPFVMGSTLENLVSTLGLRIHLPSPVVWLPSPIPVPAVL